MKKVFNIEKSFYKKVFIIALPIIIQNLITSSLNIVDTMMIGKLGENEIAAVGIANQYFFLLNILIMGLFSGIGIFTSQYWGKKDIKNIKRLMGFGIICGVIVGAIFTIWAQVSPTSIMAIFNTDPIVIKLGAEYLSILSISYILTAISFNYAFGSRCVERTTVPMIASAIALGINTVLNYALIFGNFGAPELGVKGAAIATLIARILECVIIVGHVYLTKSPLAGSFKELFDFDFSFVKRVLFTIFPVLLNEACWGLGSVMYNVIYGRIGTQAIASVQIATTINNLFMVIVFGISSATLVIVGKEVGANQLDRAKKYGNNLLKIGFIISVVLSIALCIFASGIVSIYDVSEEVRLSAKAILYVTAVVMVIRVYNIIVIVGVLRGGGDTKTSLYIEALTMWLIGVPFAFIGAFIFKLPVHWVYALCTMEEIIKGIACYKRLKGGEWVKSLVSDNK
ncbi:MAG: MATE family efflux transporter [Clostridium sp.]